MQCSAPKRARKVSGPACRRSVVVDAALVGVGLRLAVLLQGVLFLRVLHRLMPLCARIGSRLSDARRACRRTNRTQAKRRAATATATARAEMGWAQPRRGPTFSAESSSTTSHALAHDFLSSVAHTSSASWMASSMRFFSSSCGARGALVIPIPAAHQRPRAAMDATNAPSSIGARGREARERAHRTPRPLTKETPTRRIGANTAPIARSPIHKRKS